MTLSRALPAVAGTITVLVTVLLANQPDYALTILTVVVLLAILIGLRRRLAPSLLSPVHIVAFGYVVLGISGAVAYAAVRGYIGAGVDITLDARQTSETLRLLLFAASCVLLGAWLFLAATRHRATRIDTRFIAELDSTSTTRAALMIGCTIPAIMIIASMGGDLWERDEYIKAHVANQPIFALGVELGTAAIVALGYQFVSSSSVLTRIYSSGLTLGYFTIFFALGSRRLALVPVLFCLGAYTAKVSSRLLILVVLLSGVLSFFLLRVPLFLRSRSSHGLKPYLGQLSEITHYPIANQGLVLNILVGFAIIGAVAFQQSPIPSEAFWVSVNPMPGGIAGWYDVAPTLRLNVYTPYAAVGELGNAGWLATGLYFIIAGAILAYLQTRVVFLIRNNYPIFGLALVAISGIFFLFSIQYNLRSTTRMLYYAITLDIALRLWIRQSKARAARKQERLDILRRRGAGRSPVTR